MSNVTSTAPEDSASEVLGASGRLWRSILGGRERALVERARSGGVALTGEDGLLASMVREVLRAGLDTAD